uniref:FERM domain-containing protein n=1 Tax=Bursaphelenchus xylophilus TaxID=6326 RepID=A0A1I7S773_BURXY
MKESEEDFLNTSFDKSTSFKSGVIRRIQSSTSFLSLSKYNVAIQLLDDSEIISNEFGKNTTGKDILNLVCDKLEIVEKEYFGLRYSSEFKHRFWFDLNKSLHREFHHENLGLCFRFRFYPIEPVDLNDAVVKDLLCVQLQRDLLHGRLQCTHDTAAQLGALILQGNIGDYNEETCQKGYVSGYKLILKQSEKLEERIEEFHKSYKDWSKDVVFDQFLRIASRLDTYGFDPYTVKTQKNDINVVIGGTPKFLVGFVFNQIVYRIPWKYINDVDFSGKNVIVSLFDSYFTEFLQLEDSVNPEKVLNGIPGPIALKESLVPLRSKKSLKFTCPKSTFAKHLWKHLLSQKVFYTASSAKEIKPKFSKSRLPLIRGSLFRCPTARTMQEMKTGEGVVRIEKSYSCHTLPRQKPRALVNPSCDSIAITEEGDHPSVEEKGETLIDEVINEDEEELEVEAMEEIDEPTKVKQTSNIQKVVKETPNGQVVKERAAETKTITTHHLKANGTNNNVVINKVQRQKKSTFVTVISSLLTLLLMLLLISVLIYAVFEAPASVTTKIPYYGHLRYNHYLPLKTKIIKMFNF